MLFKRALLIFLLLLMIQAGWGQMKTTDHVTKWIVLESSNLQVNGSTNVNQFSCAIPASDQIDTINLCRSKTNKVIALSGCIDLDIKSFDCHNKMMTKDLRKTLKEKQFPKLFIKFISLNDLPNLSTKPIPITGQIEIEIAGVRKRFEISYQISGNDKKVVELLGARSINFSDFNLIPPKRLGGIVRAKDKLAVIFRLNMKTID
jgi:hypothetical protein